MVTHIKSKNEHKMEISDLELEKSVLENQKRRMNETIQNLINQQNINNNN